MSVERKLLVEALEWMEELNYVWLNSRISGDSIAVELRADINKIELLLTQPEQPTREPLSYKPIQDYLKSYGEEISYEYEQGFEDGVEWAEQQHGIGVDDE